MTVSDIRAIDALDCAPVEKWDVQNKILEIIGHLGTSIVQTQPSDDQIIAGHVREAYLIAKRLRKGLAQ
jgi:hypothetical protein